MKGKIIAAILLGLLLTSTSISAKDWSKIRIGTEIGATLGRFFFIL